MNSQRGHISLDVDLPPKWVDVSDQVQDILGGTHAKSASTLFYSHMSKPISYFETLQLRR